MTKTLLILMSLWALPTLAQETLQSVTEAPNGNYTTKNIWIGMAATTGVTENALNVGGKIKLLGTASTYTTGVQDANQPTIYRSTPGGSYPFDNYDNLILQAGYSNRDILFVTGSTPTDRMVVKGNGTGIGIGTNSPIANLDIATTTSVFGLNIGDAQHSNLRIAGTASGASGYGRLQTFKNGTIPGGNLVIQQDGGNVGIGIANPVCILQTASYNNTGTASSFLWGEYYGTTLSVGTTSSSYYALHVSSNVNPNGTPKTGGSKSLFYVRADGAVGIGTPDPKGYKLAVGGSMIAERIKVKLQSAWPDYVFHSDYKLLPLAQVHKYIETNRHLPNMPSALEVGKEGIDLAEMNSKLLQKIEELTLYLIDEHKKNQEQAAAISMLQEQMKRLKTLETR